MLTRDSIPLKCEVVVPDPELPVRSVLDRWSDVGLSRPALVVVPGSEQDIIDAIHYAKNAGLVLIPGGGGHAPFVPITAKTLYLDLKRFDKVTLDASAKQATISFGGGTLTRQVIETCTSQGFYTTWTNSYGVGMVGSILGGGSQPLAGLHGMMMDQLASIRIITAAGEVLELSPSSEGEKLALYYALCGAGHGLGVITSMTMKIFPLAVLQMEHDEVWCRRLIFPAAAIDLAAETYVKLQPPAPAQYVLLMFARAPATSVVPGAPVIILSAFYYGPAEKGKQASRVLFDDEITKDTIQAETISTPLSRLNEAYVPFSAHGEYKDISSAWLRITPVQVMRASFQRYVEFTDQYKDATRSTIAHVTHNTGKHRATGETPEGQAKYFECRDRGTCMLVMPWATNPETVQPMRAFAQDVKALYRQAQPETDPPRTFPNNMQPDTDLEEMHTVGRIQELRRIKKLWDGSGVFWSPYGEK
ncbi:hypothetical protein BBP40_002768 [Aspergillus hancockii]|nr:hypothetical protein BBP40_002768 [Aspergillus hancockii]